MKSREGMNEGWMPSKGLREGCPTSPILFNIYHQAVMRQALEGREEKSVVCLRVKGCEKGGAVKQKRYKSTVCCLQMKRLWWVRKGRLMKV